MSQRPIVVLGAGPAGMSSAWQLAKNGRRVLVLEKNSYIGGLGATTSVNGFRLDFGPHILCMRDTKENEAMMEELRPFFGRDPLVSERTDRILLYGRYYSYPVKIHELLAGVPVSLALRILWDYLHANSTLRFYPPSKNASFEEWGIKNLGRTLYELCFGVYSRRVWGLPTSEISSRQAQRVAKLNLTEIILRALGLKIDPVTHFRKFMYPRGGMGLLYERMCEAVRESGGQVQTNATVERLTHDTERITRVIYRMTDGTQHSVECEGVISTVPLPVVVRYIDPSIPEEILEHAVRLRYRSLQFCYVVVNAEQVMKFHWCYLLDRLYQCNRVSEQKNVHKEMIGDGRTVLLFELSCDKGDEIWNGSDEDLRRIVEGDIRRSKLLDLSAIGGFFTRRVEYAYPVYRLHFENDLFPVLKALHAFDNFLSVGRHGLFLNNSQDDNILLGKRLAQFVLKQPAARWEAHRWFEQMNEFMHLRYEGK